MSHIQMKIVNIDSKTEEVIDLHGEVLYIGRSKKSELYLADEKQVISRRHAQLTLLETGYHIKDLGSRNFTHLNDKRLEEDRNYLIRNGDHIRIGNYIIQILNTPSENIQPRQTPPISGDGKGSSVETDNPDPELEKKFAVDLQYLSQILNRLQNSFTESSSEYKTASLMKAVSEFFPNDSSEGFREKLVSRIVGLPSVQRPVEYGKPTVNQGRFDKVFMHILDVCITLISTCSKFRYEFLGMTEIKSSPENQFIDQDPAKARKMLVDETNAPHELDEYFNKLKRDLNGVLIHEVALLDGYKSSVGEGVQELLREIGFGWIEKEVGDKRLKLGFVKVATRYIPLLFQFRLLKELREKHKEISREDIGVLENKYFRKGFIGGYLKRLNSVENFNHKSS